MRPICILRKLHVPFYITCIYMYTYGYACYIELEQDTQTEYGLLNNHVLLNRYICTGAGTLSD